MAERRFIFAGGGTGGHLYPGIAVADALRAIEPDARIEFLTSDRPLDEQLLEHTPFQRVPQHVRPFPSRLSGWPAFLYRWAEARRTARRRLIVQRPVAVLGLGGYAAGPAIVAACKLGLRTAILNPDAIPGRANRRLARCAELVVLQWDVSRAYFPKRTNCQTLGCPIRGDFTAPDRAAAHREFGLDPHRPTLLVTGASQGARTVNEAMMLVWPTLATKYPRWQLLHLAGASDERRIRDTYGKAGAAAHVLSFTHKMHLALAAADLVVSRAGASTLAELTALGKPSLLLPYPYDRDRHQHANAKVLVDAGAAVMLEDLCEAELNRGPLFSALDSLIADSAKRQRMRAAATSLSRPDVARNVAAWMRGDGYVGSVTPTPSLGSI